ncbi:MRN complex-interacting protein isoform X1 [Danio rerio]|uniref:MRN complex-interacting protein n=3 Tax=Danio rerio TaxID=7955 RepID=F1QKR7_DANRE|nr:MRN complex-interacting protein [Danio rerio]|eukprot:NP_001296775.1 MRN complex-interacting protein [Danio rerio]
MVQEFNVLRCFSCQTFQVQQVKKAKKWTCKVCGEKQSLIKEFGRGAAADCRRHVQKLNALRGEQHQLNTQQLLAQGDEENENEDVYEVLDPKSEQGEAHVSRWSKYTDQTTEGPNEEEEDEDENVYTERPQFRIQGTRKRKKMSSLEPFGGNCDNYEESRSGYSQFRKQAHLPLQLEKRSSSSWNKGSVSKYSNCHRPDDVVPSARTKLPSSRQTVDHYPTACSSSTNTMENSIGNKQQIKSSYRPPTADVNKHLPIQSESPSVSSHQTFGESTIENKDSKWSKFLTIVPTQDKDVYDYESQNGKKTEIHYFTKADTGVDFEERRCPADEKDSGILNRQKDVGGNVSCPTTSFTKSVGFENAVCKPVLVKAPYSSLSLNPLFCTDEDFDDTF